MLFLIPPVGLSRINYLLSFSCYLLSVIVHLFNCCRTRTDISIEYRYTLSVHSSMSVWLFTFISACTGTFSRWHMSSTQLFFCLSSHFLLFNCTFTYLKIYFLCPVFRIRSVGSEPSYWIQIINRRPVLALTILVTNLSFYKLNLNFLYRTSV